MNGATFVIICEDPHKIFWLSGLEIVLKFLFLPAIISKLDTLVYLDTLKLSCEFQVDWIIIVK